jgi:hypothetical protein
MANAPFDFSEQRPGQVPPEEQAALQGQWASFLDQPGARSALLNFGIALMQPPSFGDTPTSQIGRAVGAGAEAAGRGELQEAKVGELEARSSAAVARAGQGEARLGMDYFRRKSIEKEGEANRTQRAANLWISDQKKDQTDYQREKKRIDDLNVTKPSNQKIPYPPPPPILDFPTWLRVRGAGLLSAGAGATEETKPPPKTGELEGD